MTSLYFIENKVSPYYDNLLNESNIIIEKINLEENNESIKLINNKTKNNKLKIYYYKIINFIKNHKINIIFCSILLIILLISFLLYIFVFKN